MGQFEKLQKEAGEPLAPASDPPKTLPSCSKDLKAKDYAVPSLKDLGYNSKSTTPYKVSHFLEQAFRPSVEEFQGTFESTEGGLCKDVSRS